VLEILIALIASGIGVWFILIEPGAVSGQIAFLGAYLVKPSDHEFSQTDKGGWEACSGGIGGGRGRGNLKCHEAPLVRAISSDTQISFLCFFFNFFYRWYWFKVQNMCGILAIATKNL